LTKNLHLRSSFPSEAKLRRSQALAADNGIGLEIARTLIDAKLRGDKRVLREQLHSSTAADVVSQFREKLNSAKSFDAIRIVEATARLLLTFVSGVSFR
jgi:CRISPR/Cas system-associated endonuclease Cas1